MRVNGSDAATDTVAPFQFSWDTSKVANGMASLVAVAYDAASNSSKVSGMELVGVSGCYSAGNAALQETLYIDGKLVASGTGTSLSGILTLQAVAQDAAGNKTTTSIQVSN